MASGANPELTAEDSQHFCGQLKKHNSWITDFGESSFYAEVVETLYRTEDYRIVALRLDSPNSGPFYRMLFAARKTPDLCLRYYCRLPQS
jgi:hypothetical protein